METTQLSEDQKRFYHDQLNNMSGNMLKRIKEQEPKWFGTLLIIHGAIGAYMTNANLKGMLVDKKVVEQDDIFIFVIAHFTMIILISIMWGWVALTYRAQFYRVRIDIEIIKSKLGIENSFKSWKDKETPRAWRADVTAPSETVNQSFYMLGVLNLVSLSIPLLRIHLEIARLEWPAFLAPFAVLVLAPIFYRIGDRRFLRNLYLQKFPKE